MPSRRRCPFCWCLFRPDPRVAHRQKACRSPDCQKARTARSQRSWLKKNPGYFHDRYPRLRACLSQRTADGYQREYRQRRRSADDPPRGSGGTVRLHPRDIQDVIVSLRLIRRAFRAQLLPRDIQDEIESSFGSGRGVEGESPP
jgi:hypothetical protein